MNYKVAAALLRCLPAPCDATGSATAQQSGKASRDREPKAPGPARARSTVQAGGDQGGGKEEGKDACKSEGKSCVAEELHAEAPPALPAKRAADTRLRTCTSESSPNREGSPNPKAEDSDSDELDPDSHYLTGEARTRVMARST